MEISANLNLHTIVPNKSPFVLYGIEVFTKYSKTVLIKRFNDFFQFQYILCYFAHSEYSKKKKFLDLIPKLPGHQVFVNSTSENAIKDRKLDLNYYIKSLVEIHNYFINYKPEAPWVQLIRDFLQVPDIEHKEEEAALIIQHKFKKYKNYLTYRSNIHEIYTNKGYAENVDRLPDGVFVEIFGYLSLQDLSKVARVSKRWNQISLQPILWRALSIFPNKFNLDSNRLKLICQRAWQLTHLDFRYCQYIDAQSLLAIAQNCNPLSLATLLLDGCDRVDDHALVCLTEKFPNPSLIRLSYYDPEVSYEFGDTKELPNDLKGGGRGLKRLSLAECRCVTDQGVAYLRKLKRLEDISLLGCYSVVDKGIELLVKGCINLKKINLSGTYVGRDGLKSISNRCKSLEHILLHNCKLLSDEDRNLFNGVLVDLKEDIFRFQLLPTGDTILGLITNNILRTRSSLTIQRVGHYVIRKLDQQNIEIDVLCKGHILSPYMTLKDVQNDMWGSSMLTLHYRLKEETKEIQSKSQAEWLLVKMPKWVPDETTDNCQKCRVRFWLLIRKHHCRSCGLVVCNNCSLKRVFISQIGYTKTAVRVCDECETIISKKKAPK